MKITIEKEINVEKLINLDNIKDEITDQIGDNLTEIDDALGSEYYDNDDLYEEINNKVIEYVIENLGHYITQRG